MHEREQALSILRTARDLLAARLTELVVSDAESILADARGESYMGEIDGLYEQIGGRLAHVNQMLAQLPPVAEPPAEAVEPTDAGDLSSPPNHPFNLPPPLALPAPSAPSAESQETLVGHLLEAQVASQVHDVATTPVTFQAFAAQAQAGQVAAAAQSLALLCDLDPTRAVQCATVFAERIAADPVYLLKAMQLRRELENENFNAAILLLYECFGLVGMESLSVLQTLRLHLRGN